MGLLGGGKRKLEIYLKKRRNEKDKKVVFTRKVAEEGSGERP